MIKSFAPGYDPKMLYVFVNRKVSIRFFEKANGHVVNPGPGTVVDKAVVESDGNVLFDFFMIANKNKSPLLYLYTIRLYLIQPV